MKQQITCFFRHFTAIGSSRTEFPCKDTRTSRVYARRRLTYPCRSLDPREEGHLLAQLLELYYGVHKLGQAVPVLKLTQNAKSQLKLCWQRAEAGAEAQQSKDLKGTV